MILSKVFYKKCTKCNLTFPIEYFTRFVRSRNMKSTKRCYYCRIKRRRDLHCGILKQCRDIWEAFKNNHACIDCGLRNANVIQADHVRGKKIMNCSEYIWWSKSGGGPTALMHEINKCVARCRFCHILKSKRAWLQLKQSSHAKRSKKQKRELMHKEQKQYFVNNEKQNRGCCVLCKRNVTEDNVEAFIFDHGDNWNVKNFTISNYINRNRCTLKRAQPLLTYEMLLCRLLCANCDWECTKKHLWNYQAEPNPHEINLIDNFLIL